MNPMIRTLLAAVVLSLLPAGAGFGQEPKPETATRPQSAPWPSRRTASAS